MANPEISNGNGQPSPSLPDLIAELAEIDQRLEKVDGNENTIERYFKRDALLEQRDMLQAEIDTLAPPPELP
jgi:hypothetical protein